TRAGTRVPATDPRGALGVLVGDLRSTRAGTRVPATAAVTINGSLTSLFDAQRGPGLASRQRPPRQVRNPGGWIGRSTRAGTRVPATALRRPDGGLGGLQRSTRAGTRVPATGSPRPAGPTRKSSTLNEGRDSRPGNGPPGCHPTATASVARSTRAGTRVPA